MKPIKKKSYNCPMKYVKVTDKITIMVKQSIPDDEAREEYLLKLSAAERRRQQRETFKEL